MIISGGVMAQFGKTNSGDEPGRMNERIITLEATLPTLATKADVSELKADTRTWVIGHWVAMMAVILSVLFHLSGALERTLDARSNVQERQIQLMQSEIAAQFAKQNTHFDQMNLRSDAIDRRLKASEEGLGRLERGDGRRRPVR
jgi:hypothetical protein